MSWFEKILSAFAAYWVRRCLRKNKPWGRIITRKDGEPYLKRYYLAGTRTGWSLFLHQFVNSDPADEGLHDHPWSWAISFVLTSGYLEVRFLDKRLVNNTPFDTRIIYRKPFRINFIKGSDYHRVVLLRNRPAWTLFLHGSRQKSWGFVNPETGEHKKYVYNDAQLDAY